MRYVLKEQECRNLEVATRREWVLTNGIGGYAMGTASGINTRRYHGHLIAATTPPTGRMLLLASIDAVVESGSRQIAISSNQYPGAIHPDGYHYLRSFEIDDAARWRFRSSDIQVEKQLYLHHGMNAVTIRYANIGSKGIRLLLRPLIAHRDHHSNFFQDPDYPSKLRWEANATVIEHQGVRLVLRHDSAKRSPVHGWYYRFENVREEERGLPARDDLYCPCELTFELGAGRVATIVASQDKLEDPVMPEPLDERRQHQVGDMLRDAAAKYIIETPRRTTLIAGYPWFTDWGRDTMISIPGLCLYTGRIKLARKILSDYAGQMHQGLIPNRFVEKGETPDYNTVDATLWFANSVYKALNQQWDQEFAVSMFDALREAFEWHSKGTLFGIRVDPEDGLLHQGEPGVQLTWMDAKIGDWVVTPRHGKPIEINGLWINLLRALEAIGSRLGQPVDEFVEAALKAEASFEGKFWHAQRGHYLDTADPADASLRPNQVIAMALPFTAVQPEHAKAALRVVGQELLTPFGLRTLGPKEAGYRGRFKGTLPELDAAYHQGTVWPWLLGCYATALIRFTGDRTEAKRILKSAKNLLCEYGLGGIAEVYDGDEPQTPGGCPWQAWSCAELLRAWVEDCHGE